MLMSFWQIQRLTCEIRALEKQAMIKQTELSNYQKYAGVLGSSSIMSIGDIAGLSRNLLPRATLFAQYSDQASSMSAMQNLQMMKMYGRVPWTGNQFTQMQIETSAFRNFKEQAMKQLKQQEAAVLAEKEKEIQLELNSIQSRIKMKQQQLDTYKQLENKRIEEATPTFGLR